MTHYHVIPAANLTMALASIKFESYEDSIEHWVRMSTTFFGHMGDKMGGLQIENAKAATGNGEGHMARAGSQALCFYWMRCDGNCMSVTWN